MKIEIDLNDILGDEFGAESLQESVHRQVVASVSQTIKAGVQKKVDTEVQRMIQDEIKLALEGKMPALVDDLLNAEYHVVDNYGNVKGDKTTVRKTLVEELTKQMVYKKANYDSEKNFLTRSIDSILVDKLAEFKTGYSKMVDEMFAKEALDFAVAKLNQKLGIGK